MKEFLFIMFYALPLAMWRGYDCRDPRWPKHS